MAKTHKIERLNSKKAPEYIVTLAQFSKKRILQATPLEGGEMEYILIDIPGCEQVTYEDFAEERDIFFWYKTMDNMVSPRLSTQSVISLYDLTVGLLLVDNIYSDKVRDLARIIAISETAVIKEFLTWCKGVYEHRCPTAEEAVEYLLSF